MTPLHNQTIQSQSSLRSYPKQSWGQWLLLGSGSILAHLLVIYSVSSIATLAQLSSEPETAVTPVDWVELPADSETVTAIPANQPAQSSTTVASAEPTGAAPVRPIETQSNHTVSQGDASGDIGIVSAAPKASPTKPAAASKPPRTAPQANSQAAPPTSNQPAPAQTTQTAPNPTHPAAVPSPIPPSPHLAMANRQLESPIISSPSPSPSPLITTEQIDVPIPDVSQTWTPPEASPSPAITQAVVIPSYLTASLTTDPLPLPDPADPAPVDEAVQPTITSRIFSSNPSLSPCPVPQEAIAFLGQTVVLQVQADETGQVVETVTQTSSQNAAYDELATCLVKTWKFRPAVTQGQAVANGLLVHITIDRS
jgi:TonB family protein